MSAARRALLRVTSAVTILTLLFGLAGLTWAAGPAVPSVRPLGALSDSLVGYWPLNETSGTRADSIASANLTATGSPTGSAGKVGNAANFNGSSQSLNGSTATVFQRADTSYTFSIWISPTEVSGSHAIIDKQGSGGSQFDYSLQWQGGSAHRVSWAVYGAGDATIGSVSSPVGSVLANQWTHVVVWHNAATNEVGVQVNGGSPEINPTSGAARETGAPFQLGVDAWITNDRWFEGQLDELGLWSRVLDADERALLYSYGTGCTYPFSGCILPTATPVSPSGNVIRNWSFDTAPRVGGQNGSIWQSMNRVVQSPYSDDPLPIDDMPYGSCGDNYWLMSRTGGSDGQIYQDFGWPGGRMYVNFEALTNNYVTRGRATILNRGTGELEEFPTFTNGSMSWTTYKYLTDSKPAGQYRLGFEFDAIGPSGGLAVDNVNVRTGYWGNDCPANTYHGQMPTTTQPTAAAQASPTEAAIQPNTPLNQNCGFEQGWTGVSHNQATRLVQVGGATGPTYAYLFTIYGNGSDPVPTDLPGYINIPFQWPGNQMMYVSWWTGPGTRATVTIQNHFTGYVRQLQSSNSLQTYNGWVKHSAGFTVPAAGAYNFEVSSPWGQIAAIDGVAISTGGFSSACGSSNSTGENNATATQHVANTQTAGTATNQPAVILTANAVATNQAAAFATYLAAQHATQTQNIATTQTQRAPATQTAVAAVTQTAVRHLTATAQGTPAPTSTPSPFPQPQPSPDDPDDPDSVCTLDPLQLVWVCAPPVVPDPEIDVPATETAWAAMQATFWAAAQQTAEARASGTAAYQQTQSAASAHATQSYLATQNARAIQTSVAAHATQTAIAEGISALATANALATQHAQQAAATQTALAQQTAASGGGATEQAEATNTAVAYATQYAGVTATANAQSTAGAATRVAQTATAQAQATANSAATAVSLATQQQQQSQATQTAVAQQTALATQANPTANAQATATAQVYATTYAQVTATAQAQATTYSATQQASGTTVPGDGGDLPPVDDRPEPGPNADCIRPTSPLQVSNWIDYEVCRVLTWFAWTDSNSDQLMSIQYEAEGRVPWGLIAEIGETFGVFGSWLTSLPWCDTGFCRDVPLSPLNFEASQILVGNWDWEDAGSPYSDQCTLLVAPLLGPYIQSGMCFCMNVACALGILPWIQLVFNVLLVFALILYIRASWFTAAHS